MNKIASSSAVLPPTPADAALAYGGRRRGHP